jgi:alkylated DNA repair dioxygenase AlkB
VENGAGRTDTNESPVFAVLRRTVKWEQGRVHVFGKTYDEPRLTRYFGDFSALPNRRSVLCDKKEVLPFTPLLREIKERVENLLGIQFNLVLASLYRHGYDSVGWHADDEKVYGARPQIAGVSFMEKPYCSGAREGRDFQIREKGDKSRKATIFLTDGSLLYMGGPFQDRWQHQVPKRRTLSATKKGCRQQRISLTFRSVES